MARPTLEALERRWRETGDPADEVACLRERLKVGALNPAAVELAAYLGHPPTRALVDSPRVINRLDQVWGLVEWGRPIALRAAIVLAREALPLWNDRRCSCWAGSLFEGQAMREAFHFAERALAEPTEARGAARAVVIAEEALCVAEEPVLEAGACDDCERATEAGEAIVKAAQVAAAIDRPVHDAADARACAEAIFAAGTALGLSDDELVRRLRQALVPWCLNAATELRREPIRERLRLATFNARKAYAPRSVLTVAGEDWEYIPVHPFADDDHLSDIGVAPKDCRHVDAYWRRGEDMCFVEMVAHPRRRSPHALGFRARWNGWDPPTLNIHIGIQAEAITRAAFEAALKNWASAPVPANLTEKLEAIPRPQEVSACSDPGSTS